MHTSLPLEAADRDAWIDVVRDYVRHRRSLSLSITPEPTMPPIPPEMPPGQIPPEVVPPVEDPTPQPPSPVADPPAAPTPTTAHRRRV